MAAGGARGAGDAAAEAIFAGERKWVAGLLFDKAPSPAYVKAKSFRWEVGDGQNGSFVRGPDGFFDTIKDF